MTKQMIPRTIFETINFMHTVILVILLMLSSCGAVIADGVQARPNIKSTAKSPYEDAETLINWSSGDPEKYYSAMNRFGPGIIPALIKTYQDEPDFSQYPGSCRRLIRALTDTVIHFNADTRRHLSDAERKQALDFLAELLSAKVDVYVHAFALRGLLNCADAFPFFDPFVTDAVCKALEGDDLPYEDYEDAFRLVGMIGGGTQTAQRVANAAVKWATVPAAGDAIRTKTSKAAQLAVKSIQNRAASPSGS